VVDHGRPHCFGTLGLLSDSSLTLPVVTRRYKILAKDLHPDHNQGKSDGELRQLELRFGEVAACYEWLSKNWATIDWSEGDYKQEPEDAEDNTADDFGKPGFWARGVFKKSPRPRVIPSVVDFGLVEPGSLSDEVFVEVHAERRSANESNQLPTGRVVDFDENQRGFWFKSVDLIDNDPGVPPYYLLAFQASIRPDMEFDSYEDSISIKFGRHSIALPIKIRVLAAPHLDVYIVQASLSVRIVTSRAPADSIAARALAESNVAYSWGDGTVTATGSHTYGKPGKYKITVTATNDAGFDQYSRTIDVFDPALRKVIAEQEDRVNAFDRLYPHHSPAYYISLIAPLLVLLISGVVVRSIVALPRPLVTASYIGPPLGASLVVSILLTIRRREVFRSRLRNELERLKGLDVAPMGGMNRSSPAYGGLTWLPVSLVLIALIAWLIPTIRQEWPFGHHSGNSETKSSFQCPDAVHAAKPAGAAIVYDATGDACGYLQYPRADIESLSWQSGTGYVYFTVRFAPSNIGNAGFVLTMGGASAARDACSTVRLSVNLPNAGLTRGCTSSVQSLSSPTTFTSQSITVLLSRDYVPVDSGGRTYVSVAAATELSDYSTTVISDYLPDVGLPPISIKLS